MKESSRRRKAKYSEEFKRDAVALAEESSVSAVAKELGISYSLLFRWKQKQHVLLSQPNEESIAYKKIREELKEQQEDLIKHRRAHKELIETHKKMEKDNRALKVVNSVLKKTTAIFSQDQLEKDIT